MCLLKKMKHIFGATKRCSGFVIFSIALILLHSFGRTCNAIGSAFFEGVVASIIATIFFRIIDKTQESFEAHRKMVLKAYSFNSALEDYIFQSEQDLDVDLRIMLELLRDMNETYYHLAYDGDYIVLAEHMGKIIEFLRTPQINHDKLKRLQEQLEEKLDRLKKCNQQYSFLR